MIQEKIREALIKTIESVFSKMIFIDTLHADGEAALNFFNESVDTKKNYDLVLLDIMLPKMDGQTLLRKFREKEKEHRLLGRKGCKIIMVSALGDAGNVMEAFRNQCDGYLSKPYNKKSLIIELKKLKLIE